MAPTDLDQRMTDPGTRTTIRTHACTAVMALAAILASVAPLLGCGSENHSTAAIPSDLTQRAYVVSEEHEELTVIDLPSLTVIGRVPTAGVGNHMAELSGDFAKAYVSSPETNEVIVVDVRKLEVMKRIKVMAFPTHLTLSRDGTMLAVMCEYDDAIAFIDTRTDEGIKFLRGFFTPHFLRYAKDGRYAYVANAGAHQITRLDLQTLSIDEEIPLDGMAPRTPAPDETGFADAQIAHDGILYAADRATGRVLVYDTINRTKLPEIQVGQKPWIVYAEHPFTELPLRHLVPNFDDQTVSLIDGVAPRRTMASLPGDSEAFGVNYSSLVPDKAFVMNRVREDVAVVDTARGVITARIPVGGNTETAATTADGRWIVAAVSSAASVVVIDAQTNAIVKRFDGVGKYPWSVTIPNGQNYCH
jgi:DNA-binding beta-propeller fold protein YncE